MSDSSVRVPEITTSGREIDCETIVRDGVTYFRQRVIALQHYNDALTGTLSVVTGSEGCAHTIDYPCAIALGHIPGHQSFRGWGERTGVTAVTAGNDVWQGTAVLCPLPDQTVGEQMTIVSTSAADDGSPAGTGIRNLDVHGLDILGNPQSEIVVMNGVTPVNTVRTDWRFTQSIHAETVGTGGVAAGTISIYRTGDATRVYNVLVPGGNMSLNAERMIPAGRTFYMTNLSVTATDNTAVSIRLRSTSTFEDTLTNGHFFLFKDVSTMQNSSREKTFRVPLKFPALSVLKFTAYASSAGAAVAVNFDGWIE